MSKMVKTVKENRSAKVLKRVTNFMGGNSYEVNALDTLKMVTASSIFGEPQYYREGEFAVKGVSDGSYADFKRYYGYDFSEYSAIDDSSFTGLKTSQIMEKVITEALDEDFGAVLDWAVELRTTYNMRLNPQIIMVLAANHPKRAEYNEKNPGKFLATQMKVMSRADEPASQLTYQLYKAGHKNNLPNILKRSWASKLEKLSRYQVAKYKNAGVGMIDVVRISHAHSEVLDELMKNGTVEVSETEKTWENLKSEGKNWTEILNTIKMGHMALLRNLRNIFSEVKDEELLNKVLADLKNGVKEGKQFPFRYYTAYKMIEAANVDHKTLLLDALEDCMDLSLDNMPKLKGTTMCLSDNSGSAWGTFNSEYGRVTVAEIGNLSAVITAKLSDEGYVGVFGNRLEVIPVKKRDGILTTMKEVTAKGKTVGDATENGIWLFWDEAIKTNKNWTNVFIYSDQQAGHGGLYGTDSGMLAYSRNYGCRGGSYIDVMKLVSTYRSKVNSKVNVFSIQTAGYPNVVIPQYAYRSNILFGWTGKEALFADSMIKFWDAKDTSKKLTQ